MLHELSAKLPLYLYHMTHLKNCTSLSYRLNPSPAPRYYNHIYLYFTMFTVYIILFILKILIQLANCCSTYLLAESTAAFIFDGSLPPACAISGRPPPPPPHIFAASLIMLPASRPLSIKSFDTPAIRSTFPFDSAASNMTAEETFCFNTSIMLRN